MKAIIPVAGIGTRLQPLTNKVPKVLLNVGGKPMLFHLIDELINSKKFDTIILITGYYGNQVTEAIKERYAGVNIQFEFAEQRETLGLGHAVYHAKEFVGEEPVLIILGDTIFEFGLPEFISSEYSAIGVKDVEDITRFGIVETSGGFISRMIEKPSLKETNSRSAIAGLYYLKNGEILFDALEYIISNDIRTKNEYQLTDALMKMIKDGEKMIPFEIQNWFDCGKPETLLSTNSYLLKRNTKTGNLIEKSVELENSLIFPSTLILDDAKVINSKLKNCIIYERAKIENATLEDCIIGAGEKISGVYKNILAGDDKRIEW